MTPLTFGSLFAGIGGMDLGLERSGMRCAWQVEIDDYATRVLAKHWPAVQRERDVRTVGAHNLPPVDVICGGFPCQDISDAGKRAGITGSRSGLWSEFARLIGELRPRYALIENVAALLGRGLDTVLCDLAALGYDAEWEIISAASVGAPHRRERVFIVAYPNCTEWRAQPQGRDEPNRNDTGWQEAPGRFAAHGTNGRTSPLADAQSSRLAQWRHGPSESAGADRSSQGPGLDRFARRRVFSGPGPVQDWTAEPAVGRMVDGVSHRLDRIRGLGNAVVPQVAEYVGRLIMEHHHDS